MKYKYDTSTRAKHNTLQATVKEKHTKTNGIKYRTMSLECEGRELNNN